MTKSRKPPPYSNMTQRTISFPVSGMHCAGCEAVISTAVKELPGNGAVNAARKGRNSEAYCAA